MTNTTTFTHVYVTNLGEFEPKGLEPLGEPVYMTQGFVILNDLNALRNKLRRFAEKADVNDPILLTGNNLLCSLAVLTWLEVHGRCNVIQYDRNSQAYKVYVVEA